MDHWVYPKILYYFPSLFSPSEYCFSICRFFCTLCWFSGGCNCSLPTNCCIQVSYLLFVFSIKTTCLHSSILNLLASLIIFLSLYWLYFFANIWFRFIDKLQQEIVGNGVKEQLQNLCNIYALSLLHKHLGDFLSTGCITPKQGALANEQLRSLYSQVSAVHWLIDNNFINISVKWYQQTSITVFLAGSPQCGSTGWRIQLHRSLPRLCSRPLWWQCIPNIVRRGVEGPVKRLCCPWWLLWTYSPCA